MTLRFDPDGLSQRLTTVKPSPTIAFTRLAAELRRSGKDTIALGELDFDTPDRIKEAADRLRAPGLPRRVRLFDNNNEDGLKWIWEFLGSAPWYWVLAAVWVE
jgi:hypothetical protein